MREGLIGVSEAADPTWAFSNIRIDASTSRSSSFGSEPVLMFSAFKFPDDEQDAW
jgi:hypothetical protein